jgi:outer membrane protein assembly complex protein YaeT
MTTMKTVISFFYCLSRVKSALAAGWPGFAITLATVLAVFATFFATFFATVSESSTRSLSRVLKFTGVPTSLAPQIKKKFPFVFEREVTLAEIDDVLRFLHGTGAFSNVEAVERDTADGGREYAIVASILRRIQNMKIAGNVSISTEDITKMLGIGKSQVFERKHLLASAEDLRKHYEGMGFHNARIEIDFSLPNETEVTISININEGSPVRISEAVIDTPNFELASGLNRIVRSVKGNILTEDELVEFQKRVAEYLTANHYLTARLSTPSISFTPDRTQAKLTYVIENPWKVRFQFDGNEFFADWTLTRSLEEEKVSGTASSPAPGMAEKIRRRYLEAGFANIEVSSSEKLKESTFEFFLRFSIKESARVKINKIQVSGNISRPEGYYARFIKVSSSDLIGKGFFNRKDIEEGSKRLVTDLQNQGYFRARVQSSRIEFSVDRSSVTIVLDIDEGPLTLVRQIRFEGVESFSKTQLTEILKIKAGAPISLRDLEESIETLKKFYRSEGFIEMRISNEDENNRIVTYNEGNTQATVTFQIYEGPRVRVGSIVLEGNSFTKEHVIMREVGFKTGDILTPEKMDETVFHLQKLDLFTNVSVRTLEEGTNIAERTVIISVTDANPGTFLLRIGGTNERNHLTVRGAAGLSYKNILGTGRGISLRVDPKYSTDPAVSYIENKITLSYSEPYILGGHNRGRVNLIHEESLFNFDKDNFAVILESNTAGFLVERDLTRNIRMAYNVYSLSNQTQFMRLSKREISTVNIAKNGPNLIFDFRDDVFNPSKGIYAFLNLEYSDPLMGSSKDLSQTVNFVKTTGSFTHYQRLFARKDFVLVNQIRGGYLANVSNAANGKVPVQETFFLGGRSTLRGFTGTTDDVVPSRWDLFPNSTLNNAPELNNFRMTSESYYSLLKAEIWFPITSSVGGTLFYDGGAVFFTQPDVTNGMPYRDSAGIGIRFITPVGPANIEFGWKLNRRLLRTSTTGGRDLVEDPAAFHISIGAL